MSPEVIAATISAVILVLFRLRKQIAAVIRTCHQAWCERHN